MSNSEAVERVHRMTLKGFITYIYFERENILLSLVINLVSEVVSNIIKRGKNKRKLKRLKKELAYFTIRIQQKHEGSILEKGAYIQYLKYQRILERIYQYALEPDKQTAEEGVYVNTLIENCKAMLALEKVIVLPTDEMILRVFYTGLLSQLKKFLKMTGGMELQAALYYMNQVLLGEKDSLKLLQENYQLGQKSYVKLEKIYDEIQVILKKSEPHIDDEWFLKQNHEAILNLGKRYLPDLNVTLDIQKNFNIIAADNHFFQYIKDESERLLLALHKIGEEDTALLQKRQEIVLILEKLNTFSDFVSMKEKLIETVETCAEYAYDEYRRRVREKKKNDNPSYQKQTLINQYRDVQLRAEYYSQILEQKKLKLVETPLMLLYGEGGIGKSHLIADTIVKRNQEEERSVLFLGQDFPEGCIVWTRFMELMGISGSIDAVLQIMNEIAKERKRRILIFIDAVNEGGGKSVWKDKLAVLLEKITAYSWLGLVLTVRKDFLRTIFETTLIDKYGVTEIEHLGLGRLTSEAVRRFFEHYGIDVKVMPYFPDEFSNPLFLRLFCEGYAKRDQKTDIITTKQIYRNYIDVVNSKMAEKFQYAEGINIVNEVIETFTVKSYGANQRNRLEKEEALKMIEAIALSHNISSRIYEFLISEGILTNSIDYQGQEYVFVTYEKLADHIYATYMLDMILEGSLSDEDIIEKISKPGILEELNYMLPLYGKELFESFPILKKSWWVRSAFNAGVLWRTDEGLLKKETVDYIENEIIENEDSYAMFFENLIRISTNRKHPYNAVAFHQSLLKMPMAKRDAEFMELFNSWNDEDKTLYQLMKWCIQVAEKEMEADEETIYLAALALSWILICTDNMLRDYVSLVLCQFLRGHISVMIRILKSFQGVDDVYILERLYGIAFGIVTFEQDKEKIKELSEYVYQTIFAQETVLPDILVRDYAKQIISYAMVVEEDERIDMNKVLGPYESTFPAVPTDEMIAQFKLDYKKEGFQDYQWSQNEIISSMQVDDHKCGYGDFGRYVFQNYFRAWSNLDPAELMKIAIQDIFDRGYNPEIHGEYDRSINHYNDYSDRKVERIGKKYQWQALYRLAAEVSDNVPRTNEATECEEYNTGSYEPNLRKFDPTINILQRKKSYGELPEIAEPDFGLPEQQWLKQKDDLPDTEKMVRLQVEQEEYLLLSGWHNWKEAAPLGVPEYDCPLKEMWFMVQAYIVKEEDYTRCIQLLQDENFWGRWMPEGIDNYSMYNREYYWSETHDYYDNEYFGGIEWKNPWRTDIEELRELMVMVPDYIYQATGEREIPGLSYRSWKKPCKTLVQGLKLKYQDENTAMYDENGKLICFDTCELFDKDIGLYFHTEALQKFLSANHYRIFWTVLGEKRIIGGNTRLDKIYDTPEYSGLLYYDEDGMLTGEIRDAVEEE